MKTVSEEERFIKYPETLYVREEENYIFLGFKQLLGQRTLESSVPDNNKANEVAVYQLVSVGNYKKTVTHTSEVEKVQE